MAELKQIFTYLGPCSYYEWPCGHQLNQMQECPVCADRKQFGLLLDQRAAYSAQIEKRDQVLKECRDLLDSCFEWTSSPSNEYMIAALQSKIIEVLK